MAGSLFFTGILIWLPLFFITDTLILQVYTRGAIRIRTMSLAILKLSLRILGTFLPTLD